MIFSTIRTLLLVLLLGLTSPIHAGFDKFTSLNSLSAVDAEVRLSGDGYGTVGFQLTGTWTATVTFEASVYGTTWVEVTAYNRTGGAGATTAEENGAYVVSSAGMRYVRARVSAYTSGPVVVVGLASPEQSIVDGGSSAGGGGGGAEGSVDVLSIAAGNNNIGNVDVVTLPAIPAGTNNIGDVDVATIAAGDNNIGNVDIVSSALPTGAATAAKQPALGTAGTSSTDVLSVQGIASGTAMPVSVASIPSHAVTNAGTFAVQNTAATPAGTNNIGDVDVLTMPTITVNAHAVTNAGTFATQVDGAALTAMQLIDNLVLAEDAAHSSTEPGVQALAVRRDANTTLATSDGDYGPLQLDAAGSLKVAITAGAGSGGTSIADDAAFTVGSTSTTPISGVYNSVLDNVNDGDAGAVAMTPNRSLRVHMVDAAGDAVSVGGGTQYAEDVASADGQIGTIAMAIRKATPANQSSTDGDLEPMQVSAGRLWVDASGKTLTVDGSGVTQPVSGTVTANAGSGTMAVSIATAPALVASSANIGDVDVLTLPALPTGTNNIGDVDVASIAAGDNNIGNVDIVTMPTVTVNAHAVTNAGTFATQAAGAAANDAAASGGPVQTGGVAQTSDPTVVTAGDAAYSLHTIGNKQVVMPYSISGSRWSYAAASGGITNTTAVTVKAAAAAGIKNCITSIQVINAHATVSTETLVLDGAAGTVLHRGWAQAAGGGYAHEFPVPICGTAATLLEVDNVTTGAAVYYNLQGYISAE